MRHGYTENQLIDWQNVTTFPAMEVAKEFPPKATDIRDSTAHISIFGEAHVQGTNEITMC